MKSHLVSQVILRQFTDPNGELNVYAKKTGKISKKQPGEVAYRDIDKRIIDPAEARWNHEIEAKLTKCLNKLKNGDVLRYEKDKTLMKRCMALHFVRSANFIRLLERAKVFYANQIIEESRTQYPDHIVDIEDAVRSEWPLRVEASIAEIIEDNLQKIDAYLDNHDIQIGYAVGSSRFVLGDAPAMTIGEDGLMGVAILDAVNFGMPFTPRHLITIKTKAEDVSYIEVTDDGVKAANKKQIDYAVSEYYIPPGADIA